MACTLPRSARTPAPMLLRRLPAIAALLTLLAGPAFAQDVPAAAPPPPAAGSDPTGLRTTQTAPGASTAPASVTQGTLTPDQKAGAVIDGAQAQIQSIEDMLAREELTGDELSALRQRAAPIRAELEVVLAGLEPRLATLDQRLAEIGPPPAEGAPPESPEITGERAAQNAVRQALDELVRRARLLQVRLTQALDGIAAREQAMFATRLFERDRSILSPELWLAVIDRTPAALANIRKLATDAWQRARSRLDTTDAAILALSAVLALLLLGPVAGRARRMGRRVAVEQAPPNRLRRSGHALWVLLVTAIAPTMAFTVLVYGLHVTDALPPRLDPLVLSVAFAVSFVAFVDGLANGILSPGNPAWRLADVGDEVAQIVRRHAAAIAIVYAAGTVISAINLIVTTGDDERAFLDGLFALVQAAMFIWALRSARAAMSEDADDTSASVPPLFAALRLLAWLAVAAILVSAVTGYLVFARYLSVQVVWVSLVFALYVLLSSLLEDIFTTGFSGEGRLGRTIRAGIGLRGRSVEQIGILLAGVTKIALILAAGVAILAPWGVGSGDALLSLRALVVGFDVGGYRLSLGTLAGAVLVLVIGVAVTRGIQRWLQGSFLPKTELDDGLKNSIGTAVGYAGVILAGVIALSSAGLNLENVAIVAGALSVGIGFGLQSIVNNFVSGLILLAERPIKVGDWVMVGPTEGNVRKISVRATEIELFDRSTLIVPNADLITQQVMNKTLSNPLGRVAIDVGVGYDSDPTRVRDLLFACATAHPEVLSTPEPFVLFQSFGDSALTFQMFCFVATPRRVGPVRSDLNFAVFKAFSEAGIAIPFPQRDINLRTSKELDDAIRALAESRRAPGPGDPA